MEINEVLKIILWKKFKLYSERIGYIRLIKSEIKDIYNVTKDFFFK